MSTEDVVQEAPEQEVEETVADPSKEIADALAKFSGAPTKEMIEGWKQQHGDVFCSGFSENELLIWKPLSRQEFVDIQTKLAQEQGTQMDQERDVVTACILWASDDAKKALVQKAGSYPTVHEQIMFNSNFVDPRVASALVIKL